jgi:response regulator RpfG family c-di-GMP phosphodiesterase
MTARSVAGAVLGALEVVVLERGDDGRLTLATDPQEWFHKLCPAFAKSEESPFSSMPFLGNFLVDAERFWRESGTGQMESGPWIETDEEGREWPLEATALCLDDRSVLLIRHLGSTYDDTRSVLQRAREFNLDNEVLEALVQARTATIREREEEIVLRLATAAEFRDRETGAHVRRIGILSTRLAEAVGSDRGLLSDLPLAAAMHDIGKIGIPDEVLLKPGALTPDERAVMQRHTTIGAEILEGSAAPVLRLAREIALNHHEKWDGSGYPNGRSGADIPLSARMVAVVDCYDALVTARVYRPAMTTKEALIWLVSHRGKHYDREILDVFLTIEPEARALYRELR